MSETPVPVPDKPFWQQRSWWFASLSFVAALPTLVPELVPMMPEAWRTRLLAVCGLCGVIAARFARKPGAQARAALVMAAEVPPAPKPRRDRKP